CGSFMFLNHSSITRPPPSLLPGSDRTRSPALKRYYAAATTTGRLWPHSVCCVGRHAFGSISSFRSPSRGNRRADARVLFDRSHPLLPVFCPKDTFGSPKFPANPSCICPALRLRPGLHARLITAQTEMGSILCFLRYLLLNLEAAPFRADDADYFFACFAGFSLTFRAP